MARKILVAVLSAAVISGGISVSPAAAAKISNGVACSKSGAKTTVSGFKYRCAKNTMVKNSKLTWLSTECLTAIKQYGAAVKARKSVSNSGEQLAELDAEYQKAVTALASVTTAYDNARAQVTKSQAAMNAATVASEKQALATALSKLANAVLVLSGSKSKLSAQVKDLEAKRELISSAPEAFKESVAEAKGSASLLCKKGF
jgi:chromosome segregation ATPase